MSGRFRQFMAIDWSGAQGQFHKGIALAVADSAGGPPVLVDRGRGWSRAEVLALLRDDLPQGTLVGMDLGIALPFEDHGAYFPGWADSPAVCASLRPAAHTIKRLRSMSRRWRRCRQVLMSLGAAAVVLVTHTGGWSCGRNSASPAQTAAYKRWSWSAWPCSRPVEALELISHILGATARPIVGNFAFVSYTCLRG